MKRLLFLALIPFLCSGEAMAGNVVADVSERKVDVTVGYNGTKLLVFGAIKKPADIAVVVEGPPVQAKLYTKKKELGIWVNGDSAFFGSVPGFYAVATTRAVSEFVKPAAIRRYGLSLAGLDMPPQPEGSKARPENFLSLKQAQWMKGHYQEKQKKVEIIEKNLFRASFDIPASAPKGTYTVRVHAIEGGRVVSTDTVNFTVETVGLEASIYRLAYKRPFLYAFLALVLSLGLGGVSSYVFRRLA